MELVRGRDGQLHPVLPPQFPFYVASRPEAGRCLMSTREVRPGEVVLTDSAIILGPASPLVCIVCCSSRGQRSRCPGCRHVLCSSCASHSEEECAILAKIGHTADMYNIILPVRFGLLQQRDPEMFEWLLQNMDHNQERNNNEEMFQSTDRMTTLLSDNVPGITKELAWKIVGILFTNCFEFKIAEIDARALYPLVSLVNHSCIPNMHHTNLINQLEALPPTEGQTRLEGEIVVMQLEAQRTILPNTELTIRYNDYMMSQIQRQKFLSEQWFFRCQCSRCQDPTEFGTMTSSLPCPDCQNGCLLPSPYSKNWECRNCEHWETENEVEERENEFMRLAQTRPVPYNIRTCLQQLHDLSKVLHNNHIIIVNLKQKFLFNFSINMKKIRDLSPDQRRKLSPLFLAQEKYCRQLLTYHEVLDPGKSSIKTKILLELRKVLMIQTRVMADDPGATRDDLANKLEEVKHLNYLVFEKVPL